MKFLATLTIAILLPFSAQAQDQGQEIVKLKSELKESEAEKEAIKGIVDKFAKEMTALMGANVTLDEIPDYLARLATRANKQEDQLGELAELNKFYKERNENLLREKKETVSSIKKLGADLAKVLQLEESVSLEKVPMIVAELVDKNKDLHHQTEELNATIADLRAGLEKLKRN